jgi:hypothetical protein
MAKEYFPHDYCARLTLREIRKDYGLEGLGFYWCFVEMLHEEGGYIKETELESIAYDLRVSIDLVQAVIRNYDLFVIKKGKISSERVLRNIKKRAEISEARKSAAESRWNRQDEQLPMADIPTDEQTADTQTAKQFYIASIERCFDKFLENASGDMLFSRNIYDYKGLFDTVIAEVKSKDYVIIDRKNVPVYRFLQVIQRHIKKNGDIKNLAQALNDVQDRYVKGKIKNRANYLISTLYNAALFDCGDE